MLYYKTYGLLLDDCPFLCKNFHIHVQSEQFRKGKSLNSYIPTPSHHPSPPLQCRVTSLTRDHTDTISDYCSFRGSRVSLWVIQWYWSLYHRGPSTDQTSFYPGFLVTNTNSCGFCSLFGFPPTSLTSNQSVCTNCSVSWFQKFF